MKKIISYLFIGLFIINFVFTSSFQDLNFFDAPSAHAFPGSGDTDGDGVLDVDDLDADNDGTLDFTECTNLMRNSGFNDPAVTNATRNGNNIANSTNGVNVNPWTLQGGNRPNIVRVDGAGGFDYRRSGPFEDANPFTGDGEFQYYLDIVGGGNDFFQTFTLPLSGQVTYGGFFSTRDNNSGNARLRIFSGSNGAAGNAVVQDDSGVINVTLDPDLGSENTPWTEFSRIINLPAGTYSFVVSMDNSLNFDEGFALSCLDSDGDGIFDFLDLDSDNDGIADIYELGDETVAAFDIDGNGTIDISDGFVDDGALTNSAANNGIDDRIENRLGLENVAVIPVNTSSANGDNTPDYLDLDSDRDGIPDATEARASGDYVAYPSIIDTNADSDDDGILDIYDSNASAPAGVGTFGSVSVDFKTNLNLPNDDDDDSDTIPDYLDTDSDDDGILDQAESGNILAVSFRDPDGNVNDPLLSGTLIENDNNISDLDFRSIAIENPLSVDILIADVIVNDANQGMFPVSGTCNEDGDQIIFSNNDTDLTPNPAPICTDGMFAVDLDLSSISTEGDVIITAEIIDDQGVFSTVLDTETLEKDTIAPITTVSLDTLTNGPDNPTLNLSSIETNSGFDRYEIEYIQDDGVAGSVSSTTTIDTTSDTVVTLALDPDELVHTIIVRTFDMAGNVSEVTTILPPVINFTEGTQISNTTIDDIVFTVDTPTDQPLTNIDISGPASVGAILECQGSDGGTTDPFDDVAICTISNVTNSGSIIVNAEDSSNGAIGQNQNTYIIDTELPLITFNDDVESESTMNDTIVITASDDNLDDTTLVYGFSPDAVCDENDTFDQPFVNGETIEFNDESNNGQFICVMATDTAGNVNFQSSAEAIDIDVTPPIVTIDLLDDVFSGTDQEAYIVTGTCTEGDGDVTVTVTNALPEAQAVSCETGGTWSAAVDVTSIPEGIATIVANAEQTDAAGNLQEATPEDADKDTELPVILFTDDVETGPVETDAITITVSDDNLDDTTLVYGFSPDAVCDENDTFDQPFVNGETIEFNDESNNGQFICVMATDTAGNTAFQSSFEPINIDTTAPAVTIDSLDDVVFDTDQEAYIVTGTCTEGDGDVSVILSGAIPESQVVTCDLGGTWTSTFDVTGLPEGEEVIVVDARQTDGVGNTQDAITGIADKNTELPPLSETDSPESDSERRSSSRNGSRRRVPPQLTNNIDTLAGNSDSQSLLEKMLNGLTQAQRDLIQKFVAAKNAIGASNTTSTQNITTATIDRPIEFPDGSCAYFTQHMRKGDRDGKIGREKQELGVPNIIEEIAFLQTVLIQQGFTPGPVDGIFGTQTESAVNQWQVKHFDAVLAPWNLSGPTGRFYQSSERWMNEILGCPDTVRLDNGKFLDFRNI